jgi:hypothetical protein
MLAAMKVLRGMFILRRIATADMPAFQAQPQMDPGVSNFHAVFTNLLVCRRNADFIEMSALSHSPPSPADCRRLSLTDDSDRLLASTRA